MEVQFGYSRSELIWYIIMAEFITYSVSRGYKNISDKVKDGTIVNMFLKPINFCYYFLAEESANLLKICINVIGLLVLGITYGGILNLSGIALLFVIISCILSIMIGLMMQLVLGLISFDMEETKSLWFIIQKFQFLLVFVPLEFYGVIVQKILLLLPTTYLVYAPSRILVKFELRESLMLILMQIVSIIGLSIISAILYKRGVKKINANGG